MASAEQLSRKERRKVERQARKEQLQQEREKQKKSSQARKLAATIVGALLVVGMAYWAYGKWTQPKIGEFVPSLGNRHIGQAEIGLITYNSDPPTSGPHLPQRAPWGVHEQPVPKELQVHNLEDAGVVVQYNCPQETQECGTLVEQLTKVVQRYDTILLAPYPGMSHKIALTAWTRIDKFDAFDEQRIVRFIESYIGIGHHARK